MLYRDGSVYVVAQARSKDSLSHDLRAIDHRLFFEKQIALDGAPVWCVVCDLETDQPPVTLLEWRDEFGRPIPELASGILDRVQKMERTHDALVARVRKQNEELKAAIDKRRDEAYAEIARDMIPKITGRGRTVLERGVHLRQSRSRMREQGKIR